MSQIFAPNFNNGNLDDNIVCAIFAEDNDNGVIKDSISNQTFASGANVVTVDSLQAIDLRTDIATQKLIDPRLGGSNELAMNTDKWCEVIFFKLRDTSSGYAEYLMGLFHDPTGNKNVSSGHGVAWYVEYGSEFGIWTGGAMDGYFTSSPSIDRDEWYFACLNTDYNATEKHTLHYGKVGTSLATHVMTYPVILKGFVFGSIGNSNNTGGNFDDGIGYVSDYMIFKNINLTSSEIDNFFNKGPNLRIHYPNQAPPEPEHFTGNRSLLWEEYGHEAMETKSKR